MKNRRSDHVFSLGVTVFKSHWGSGIGRAIMDRLIKEVRAIGGKKIVLVCQWLQRG